jgi:hypothetical protein
MSNIININPYAFAGCTDTQPSSVLIATPDGTPNNALMFSVLAIGGGGPPTPMTFEIAHNSTFDISNNVTGGLAAPFINILASSESSGGDATDTHSWVLSSNQAPDCIAFIINTTALTEDIGEAEGFTFIYDQAKRAGGTTADIYLDYTGSNCGGSASATRVVITIQD